MGIYIKDMEMPKVCEACPFSERVYDPGYYQYEKCKALGKIFNECRMDIDPFEEKLNDCPLNEIPTPLGRLIDAEIEKEKEKARIDIDLVKCGECKWWDCETSGCTKIHPLAPFRDWDFCSYGERKE